jgi:hypothetical protein
MKQTILMLWILTSMGWPPIQKQLTQDDIPFPVDFTQVDPNGIFKYYEARPTNSNFRVTIKVTDLNGHYGILTCNNPAMQIPIDPVTIIDPNDPDGISRIHQFDCTIRVGTIKRVEYLTWSFTNDPNGESYAPATSTGSVPIDIRKRRRWPILQ